MPIPEGSISQRLGALETQLSSLETVSVGKSGKTYEASALVRTKDGAQLKVKVNYSPIKNWWVMLTQGLFRPGKCYVTVEKKKEMLLANLKAEFERLKDEVAPMTTQKPLHERITSLYGIEGNQSFKDSAAEVNSRLERISDRIKAISPDITSPMHETSNSALDLSASVSRSMGAIAEQLNLFTLFSSDIQIENTDNFFEEATKANTEFENRNNLLNGMKSPVPNRGKLYDVDINQLEKELTTQRDKLDEKIVKQFTTFSKLEFESNHENIPELITKFKGMQEQISKMKNCSPKLMEKLQTVAQQQLIAIAPKLTENLSSSTLDDLPKFTSNSIQLLNEVEKIETFSEESIKSIDEIVRKQLNEILTKTNEIISELNFQSLESISPIRQKVLSIINQISKLNVDDNLKEKLQDTKNKFNEIIDGMTKPVNDEITKLNEEQAKLNLSKESKKEFLETAKKLQSSIKLPQNLKEMFEKLIESEYENKNFSQAADLNNKLFQANIQIERRINSLQNIIQGYEKKMNPVIPELPRIEEYDLRVKLNEAWKTALNGRLSYITYLTKDHLETSNTLPAKNKAILEKYINMIDDFRSSLEKYQFTPEESLRALLSIEYQLSNLDKEAGHPPEFFKVSKAICEILNDEVTDALGTDFKLEFNDKALQKFASNGFGVVQEKIEYKRANAQKIIEKSESYKKTAEQLQGELTKLKPGTSEYRTKEAILKERKSYEEALNSQTDWSTLQNDIRKVMPLVKNHADAEATAESSKALEESISAREKEIKDLEQLKFAY